MSARHRHAPLFQQFMSTGSKFSETLVRNYFEPRGRAMAHLLEQVMRDGEFRRVDHFHCSKS